LSSARQCKGPPPLTRVPVPRSSCERECVCEREGRSVTEGPEEQDGREAADHYSWEGEVVLGAVHLSDEEALRQSRGGGGVTVGGGGCRVDVVVVDVLGQGADGRLHGLAVPAPAEVR
jgi:hypothetical protein